MRDTNEEERPSGNYGIMRAIKIPAVIVAMMSVFSASITIGALMATLERHLSFFELTAMQVSSSYT